jgi:uncharacterized membrane protein YfcA
MDLPPDFALYIAAGFVAQLIDGALGMAYGVSASSLLMAFGVPPAATSATVHAAECFTTGASGLSHHAFGNVDRFLFRRLLIPAVIGAIIGAYLLSSIGDVLKPWVSGYLLIMGLVIVAKAFTRVPAAQCDHAPRSARFLRRACWIPWAVAAGGRSSPPISSCAATTCASPSAA